MRSTWQRRAFARGRTALVRAASRVVLACGAGVPTLRPSGQNDLLMTGQESPIAGEGEKGR